jgi:hypothetical protein
MTEHYRIAGRDYYRDPKTGRLRELAIERAARDRRIAFQEDETSLSQAQIVWACVIAAALLAIGIVGFVGA